jgi:hypothetical protein
MCGPDVRPGPIIPKMQLEMQTKSCLSASDLYARTLYAALELGIGGNGYGKGLVDLFDRLGTGSNGLGDLEVVLDLNRRSVGDTADQHVRAELIPEAALEKPSRLRAAVSAGQCPRRKVHNSLST